MQYDTEVRKENGKKMQKRYANTINWSIPSIFGATLPRDNLLNFNEVIPGGRYSSSRGSTDSFITNSAAWKQKHKYCFIFSGL